MQGIYEIGTFPMKSVKTLDAETKHQVMSRLADFGVTLTGSSKYDSYWSITVEKNLGGTVCYQRIADAVMEVLHIKKLRLNSVEYYMSVG